MACKICKNPKHAEMIISYAKICNYRTVANIYRVNFKTLQRHITQCVYSVMGEAEEAKYEAFIGSVSQMLTREYMQLQKKRPKSIITNDIKYTWSRRSWGKNNK